MADKKVVTENTEPKEEKNENLAAGEIPVEVIKKHPVKDFFTTHKKKILGGLGLAGAFGAGLVADRLGIRLGAGKKTEDDGASDDTE